MGSIGGSDGTDVHLQKLLELDTDHLYRHLTSTLLSKESKSYSKEDISSTLKEHSLL